jgi:uncharacterized membrane protein
MTKKAFGEKNMKKVRRKEEEKRRKKRKEEKREKKIKKRIKENGEKWNKQDYFISLTCVGVTNLTMSVAEYKMEELKTAFNKITSIFLHYNNV